MKPKIRAQHLHSNKLIEISTSSCQMGTAHHFPSPSNSMKGLLCPGRLPTSLRMLASGARVRLVQSPGSHFLAEWPGQIPSTLWTSVSSSVKWCQFLLIQKIIIRIGNEIPASSTIGTWKPLETGYTSYDLGHALYFTKPFVMHSFHCLSVRHWTLVGHLALPGALLGLGSAWLLLLWDLGGHCFSKQPR